MIDGFDVPGTEQCLRPATRRPFLTVSTTFAVSRPGIVTVTVIFVPRLQRRRLDRRVIRTRLAPLPLVTVLRHAFLEQVTVTRAPLVAST